MLDGSVHDLIQIVATGGDDCKVNIWRVTNATSIRSLAGHNNPVECLCFDESEEYIASGSQAGGIRIHDLKEVGVSKRHSKKSNLAAAQIS